uniref:RRM domain-containing protein n=1 Tax=Steinernema glaseri TaxID=37863 RepID=A0A1I7Y7J6_9BILA
MDNRLDMRWALICSIKEDEPTDTFEEFSMWLTKQMAEQSRKIGLHHSFAPKPEVVLRSRINNQNDNAMNYREIHDLYPGVLLVVHILPGENSQEYTWMKEYTQKYGLIRQGIQRENAEKRFEGANLDIVLGNINQWVARRLYQLVSPPEKNDPFRMHVDFNPSSPRCPQVSHHRTEVSNVVNSVLHYDPVPPETNLSNIFSHADAVCEVTGFPAEFNEFQLAALFHLYKVKSVVMGVSGTAVVEFFNKFHAVQAAIEHHAKKLDNSHKLSVVPIHQISRMQAGITI